MGLHVQSTKVQQGFGEIMEQAMRGEDVVVERYGSPRVVIIEYGRYQKLVSSEQEAMRARLQAASEAASARAAGLTDDEVDALIEQARQEAQTE
jgi:PHD/YefM family antitoxin component YafN of YafNO toxin-antitoxin module